MAGMFSDRQTSHDSRPKESSFMTDLGAATLLRAALQSRRLEAPRQKKRGKTCGRHVRIHVLALAAASAVQVLSLSGLAVSRQAAPSSTQQGP